MKVLHVSSEKEWRGGEQQIAHLIEEHSKMGVEIHVAVRRGSEFEKYCFRNNTPHIALPLRNAVDLPSAISLKSYCRDERIDLIHLHSAKSHAIGVMSAMLGNKAPMVLSRRVAFRPKSSWITRWRYNHPSIRRIIGVSNNVTEIMKAYVNKPEVCITVHSAIDVARFETLKAKSLRKEFSIPEGTVIIANTSALDESKDYYTFIETITILRRKGISVKGFIIGDGPLRTELERFAEQKQLAGTVIFTGYRRDANEILPSADVFLMTSTTEGLGTSILNAFACKVPVVATATGGIPEMVINRVTGMLCDVGNADQLANAIENLIKDKVLREKIIVNAFSKLMDFSKEKTAERTFKVYREVLGLQK